MKVIATNQAPAAIGPYSQGYVVNGLLFTSGQVALLPESGAVAGESIEARYLQLLQVILYEVPMPYSWAAFPLH